MKLHPSIRPIVHRDAGQRLGLSQPHHLQATRLHPVAVDEILPDREHAAFR